MLRTIAGVVLVAVGLACCSVRTMASESSPIVVESKFGKAIIDTQNPKLTGLWLRNPDGTLSGDSILSRLENASISRRREGQGGSDSIAFVNGAYTYVVNSGGKRYESCLSRSHKIDVIKNSSGRVIKVKITGIELMASDDPSAPVSEDWEISTSKNGSELIWKITQRWLRDFSASISGTPALFLAPFGGWYYNSPLGRIAGNKNNVTSTIWYDPTKINAESFGPPYLTDYAPILVTDAVCQTVNVRDTWAIYKLFTNMHMQSDLRAQVAGGYLFRRGGSWGAFNEIGSTVADNIGFSRHAGDSERVTLALKPVDKFDTGYQLGLDVPDKALNLSLRDLYGSMMNGGAIADQKRYYFGNQSEGCIHEWTPWIIGFPFAVGIPGSEKLSACPYDTTRAYKGMLQAIVDSVGDDARTDFGLNKYYNDNAHEKVFIDGNLNVIIGSGIYYRHTGDAAFIEKNLPVFERLLKRFIDDIDPKTGLFLDPRPGPHWYYDELAFTGYNTYFNTFFYKSLTELAGMERLLGNKGKAASYTARAEALKTAINKFLWTEDAPGGPRYADWVDLSGKRYTYFVDFVQYPTIVFGVASKEQARKIIATADARLFELTAKYGYAGHASISSLWDNGAKGHPYGEYMNGGTILVMTYFEIVARAMAGDNEGAINRLKTFCQKYDQMSWVGNNAANIQGEMTDVSGDREPYLADCVTVTASAINGILGINPTWDKLEVIPHMPGGWRAAKAFIIYKGVRHEVTVNGEKVTIKPMDRVYGKDKDAK
ncbi:MAG: MGH1-like glycoside hydrolase domain-containing protein [Armatimonadota bacterium]